LGKRCPKHQISAICILRKESREIKNPRDGILKDRMLCLHEIRLQKQPPFRGREQIRLWVRKINDLSSLYTKILVRKISNKLMIVCSSYYHTLSVTRK